ncbi:MAG: hypothetical protein J1F40_02265 [Prevotellaceae bacterium]|nr:hypothetical protein [Prevotellaceae bacterium]
MKDRWGNVKNVKLGNPNVCLIWFFVDDGMLKLRTIMFVNVLCSALQVPLSDSKQLSAISRIRVSDFISVFLFKIGMPHTGVCGLGQTGIYGVGHTTFSVVSEAFLWVRI